MCMAMSPLKDHLHLARLDGRAYVVLGAGGGGLGDATCEALAGAGAQLLCVDRSEEQAHGIAHRVGGQAYVADVTKRDEVQALFDHARSSFAERFAGGGPVRPDRKRLLLGKSGSLRLNIGGC